AKWIPVRRQRTRAKTLMRPRSTARRGEVVRIGEAAPDGLMWLGDLVRDAVPLAIRDRLVLRLETQAQLLAHVARRGPAHQRLDLARLGRLVVEHPLLGLGMARLHGGLGRLVDAREAHGVPVVFPFPVPGRSSRI